MITVAKTSIYEKIEKKGQSDAQEITRLGKLKAKQLEETILGQAQDLINKNLSKTRERSREFLKTKITEIEQNAKQKSLLYKKELIKNVFTKALDKLKTISDDELQKLVKNLILSEKINGDEIIQVNSQDYELYLRNFSSKAKGDLVVMDKLNQELGSSHYNLKLSSTPANINGGFIIIGEAFDIDFSFETILSSLQEKYETEVAEKMFVEGE
mgnify:CR=1 FL=1|jgi:V/A-type H+-transporting ATPase subunit E